MSLHTLRVAAIALLVTAAACGRAPTAPQRASIPQTASLATDGFERIVEDRIWDFTGTIVAYPCGDDYSEQILMEGQVFTRWTVTYDGAGGVHSLTRSMPIGLRGIGLSSGAEYKVTEREHGTFNQGSMGQTASVYKSFLNISAPSIHARARLVLGGTFVVNANGELVIEKPVLRADCEQ